MRLRLLRGVPEEVEDVATSYNAVQPGLGREFLAEVHLALHRIREHPLAVRRVRGEIRVRSLPRFPYRIYFHVQSGEIRVLAILHRRRRPGHLRTRGP
jgi:plasmid stabilization system protein ParE